MKKRVRFEPGSILQVQLSEDLGYSYARMLSDAPYVAFYESRTLEEQFELENIVKSDVLFVLALAYEEAILVFGWKIVGTVSLEAIPESIPPNFIQHPTFFADLVVTDPWGNTRPTDFEECQDLERLAIWGGDEAAQRLADHYSGRENKRWRALRVKSP